MTTEVEDLEHSVEVENDAMEEAYNARRGNTAAEAEPKQVEAPKVDEDGTKTEEPKGNEATPKEPEQKEAEPKKDEPKEVQPLDPDEARAILARVPQLEHSIQKLSDTLNQKGLDRLFGTVGELQQTIKRIQDGAKVSPQTLKITRESLKRLGNPDTGFPDIAALLAEDLSEAMLAQQPEAKPAQTETPDVERLVSDRLNTALSERDKRHAAETEALHEALLTLQHPDWKPTIQGNDFNLWVGTLPQDRQREILTTSNALVFGQALNEFKARQKSAATTRTTKQQRLEAAVLPDSAADDANHDELTEQEAMAAAYRNNELTKKRARL